MTASHISLAGALIFLWAGVAGAAPLASAPGTVTGDQGKVVQAQIIQVRAGCGFGEHRGRFGGCRLNHGPRGRIRRFETGAPRGCPPGLHRFRGFCR